MAIIKNTNKEVGEMFVDWTKLFQTYKGEWVALKSDEKSVISHGKNAKSVLKEASETYKSPILLKVPKNISSYVG